MSGKMPGSGTRLWLDEHKRFLNEKGFELAQSRQRFDNAFSWYQGSPFPQHLQTMKDQFARMGEIIAEIEARHPEVDAPPQQMMDQRADPEGR